MKIEQANTLLIISLVLLVLLGVAGTGFLSIRGQVTASIEQDLDRAQQVFQQAQKSRSDELVTLARSLSSEPDLIAAALSSEISAVRRKLERFYPHSAADFMAVYLGSERTAVATAGNMTSHIPSNPGLEVLDNLVERIDENKSLAAASAVLHGSWLQLVAVALESPLADRIGVLLVGKRFTAIELEHLQGLVSPHLAIVQDAHLLASSSKQFRPPVRLMGELEAVENQGTLEIGGRRYSIRLMRPANQLVDNDKPVKLVFAANQSGYWVPYKSLAKNTLYFSVLVLLPAVLFSVAISRRSLTQPIQLLERATLAVAKGNMKFQVPLKRNDDLGRLGESFNAMLGALNSSQSELERNRQRFRDFASSSSDWLWETDFSGHFTFVSSSVSETLGMGAQNWLGRTLAEVFPGSNLGELRHLFRSPDKKKNSFKDTEIWVHALNGEAHCLRLNGVPVFSGKTFKGFRGTARDITKHKQDEKRMVILANQDHLTGLSNRRRFLEELDQEIRRAERHDQSGVLLLIDLDHLKLVNDTAGHAAGDQIIVQVAGLLNCASRDQDYLARISGDEFAVAYSEMGEELGMKKARQLLDNISALKPRYGGRTLNISASVGMVTFPGQGKIPVELMAKADAAMSVAKSSGRNRVYRYDETDMMRERMDNQLVWKDRLLESLEKDALQLVFQPIVSVSGGQVHHYEVLVRMVDDNGALIAPGSFIPAAEQFGLIQRLDRVVITKSIAYLAELPDEMRDVGFAINLSGLSVGRQDTYELIERVISESGVDPARITFEITETAACEQLNNAVEFIRKIRRLGCKVSLDDFGVGFSSFSYLKHLHADVLKIDGSFIRDIHNNNEDQLFVKALVDVAGGMGMRTIAEFVENEQVFERIRNLGVDYVQGYYLGKPRSNLKTITSGADSSISASVA